MTGLRLVAVGAIVLSALALPTGAGAGNAAGSPADDAVVYVEGESLMLAGEPFAMKGFNYYPRDYGWTNWADWDWEAVDRELALAEEYGANTIRTGFEYPYMTGDLYCQSPSTRNRALPEYLDAIDRFLSIAHQHNLKVVLWLGAAPCWQLWDPARYGALEDLLESLIPAFAGDPRIAAWDLATDIDAGMLSPPPIGGYGVTPHATREDMVTLLGNMAGTVRALDPGHLLTVGFAWPSSSILAQDFVDFLMPQFFGGDARNVLERDEAGDVAGFVDWGGARDSVIDQLEEEIRWIQSHLQRPMPIVLSEYGSPSLGPEGSGFTPEFQQFVYETTLEMAFLRVPLAGALNWVLTDFTWPPQAFTLVEPGSFVTSVQEHHFGIVDADYEPKPAAEVARAYYADRPEIEILTAPTDLAFVFDRSFIPSEEDPRQLCAAFDWIEYRDEEGQALLRLDVGTPEARPHLQAGFFTDEGPWAQDAETFAWAGGAEKTALVRVEFPEGTQRVVFRAITDESVGAQVFVDGEEVATITMNPGWRAHTVGLPAGEAAPSLGDARTIRGAMNLPISEGTVDLEVSYDGSAWSPAVSVTPTRGRFAAPVRFEHGGTVAVRATWSGAGHYLPAASESFQFRVASVPSSISFSGLPATVTVGSETAIPGRFEPGVSGIGITITVTGPDGSQTGRTATTGEEGGFEFRFNPAQAGAWSLAAVWEGDADYEASQAGTSLIVVTDTVPTSSAPITLPAPGGEGGASVRLYAGLAAGVALVGAATGLVLVRRRRKPSG